MLMPVPTTLEEQRAIATTLDMIDAKAELQRKKLRTLAELLQRLLGMLIDGELSASLMDGSLNAAQTLNSLL